MIVFVKPLELLKRLLYTRAYIAVTLVHHYLCVVYKIFSHSVSHYLSHPCGVEGLVAISQVRELRLKKDEAHQL